MNYRIEIVSNQSVQDEIVELMEQEIPEIEYTLIPAVQGRGRSSKKLGDTTWPEQNFVLFAYVEKKVAVKMKAIILAVKKKFPTEGIALFCTQEVEL